MPGKADYWKYFIVQEMLAVCQIAGCTKPNVSLGPLPKAGEKKRISKYSLLLMYIFNCFLSVSVSATSTAVERLFSAAGMIMEAKRNKLSPKFVDKLLFLREAYLLGICKMDWK